MSLFEYIHSLRTALFRTHWKSAEDDADEDAIDYSETEDALDPSFHLQDTDYVEEHDITLRLPGQGVGQEQRYVGTDFTGLPQGSDSSTPLGGHILPSLADPSAMGASTATAQPGDLLG